MLQAGLMRACGMIVCMSNDADNVCTPSLPPAPITERCASSPGPAVSSLPPRFTGPGPTASSTPYRREPRPWLGRRLKPNVSDFFDLVDVHGHFRLSFDTAVIGENSPLRGQAPGFGAEEPFRGHGGRHSAPQRGVRLQSSGRWGAGGGGRASVALPQGEDGGLSGDEPGGSGTGVLHLGLVQS